MTQKIDPKRGWTRTIADGIDWISGIIGKFIGYSAVVLTVISLFYEVIARYVFNSPTKFTLETGLIMQVILVSSAAAYILKEGGHVSIELVTERLPVRVRHWMNFITSIMGALLCLLFCVQVWRTASWSSHIGNLTETLEIRIGPIQFFMFGGFALLGIQFLVQSYRSYLLARTQVFRSPDKDGGIENT
jgi:TRAP-type C4-dicarboxylate transport system permease small subunit